MTESNRWLTRRLIIVLAATLTLTGVRAKAEPVSTAANIPFQGGTVMQTVSVFLIFWLPGYPNGVLLDPTVPGGFGNFFSLTEQFFRDIGGSSYFNIVTQYPGTCQASPINPTCVTANTPQSVQFGGVWVDAEPYPNNRGSAANPLQDSDIRDEVVRAINTKQWPIGLNSEFFVFTGAGIEECFPNGQCTTNAYCAYHFNFSIGNNPVIYAYMSDVSFNGSGCNQGITTAPNGQLSSDRETVAMSHEFIESVTDPLGQAPAPAWINLSSNQEIADNCAQEGNVTTLGVSAANPFGNSYAVQDIWSNVVSGCVLSLPSIVDMAPNSGPNVGGTQVQLYGGGFYTNGTRITVGGAPATNISCPQSIVCYLTTPSALFVGSAGNGTPAQTVDIQITVNGMASQLTSGDQFTYTAGPSCQTDLSCLGSSASFPLLDVQCPVSVNFYDFFQTPNQALIATATAVSVQTSELPNTVAACDPKTQSCSLYSAASSPTCGGSPPGQPPNFCQECIKTHGICGTEPNGRKICIHQ
jgi:IPT/TIG domain